MTDDINVKFTVDTASATSAVQQFRQQLEQIGTATRGGATTATSAVTQFAGSVESAMLCALCLGLFLLIYYAVQYEDRYRYPILWVTFLLGSLPITHFLRRLLKSLNFERAATE